MKNSTTSNKTWADLVREDLEGQIMSDQERYPGFFQYFERLRQKLIAERTKNHNKNGNNFHR